ncbi:Methyltransf-25 domain-containing protein [Favolaschia claudopus]|uniref:Methyltransf-25 domain-containing protein n=1 Tax=Favolaschia claudopus TaxID=2862362 RepID=A0AAW0DBD3_9AGAR
MSSLKRPATSPGSPRSGPSATVAVTVDGGSPATAPLNKRHSTTNLSCLKPGEASPIPTTPAPPRPPRNPARAGASEPKPKKPRRPSTATGAREEVTPWEFFPANAEEFPTLSSDETVKQSKTQTATGRREDVVPWELFPAPSYDTEKETVAVHGSPIQPNHTRSIPYFIPAGPSQNALHFSYSAPPSPENQQRTCTHPLLHPKFSTADRTILQELKRNIDARAAQFVIKGGGVGEGEKGSRGLGRAASMKRGGSKHHAYNRDEVPYPRSYASEVLDLDVWETLACQSLCDSLTFNVFATPPTKVLDIGCGTGTWVLSCGKAWKKCHFVGLDVVPLHPDLGTSELSSRITWVQANFLEGLPFPNEEFDYVHIKRIALGVPEDQWDTLFEEIARVLKPGGAFELIEEDLFFPGKPITEDDDSDSDAVSELRYAHNDSASDDNEDDEASVVTGTGSGTGSGGSRVSYDGSAPTPNTSLGASGTPPRTASPLPMIGSLIREEIVEETGEAVDAREEPAAKKKSFFSSGHPPHHRHSYQPRSSSVSNPTTTMSTSSLLAGLGPAVVPPVPVPSVQPPSPVERKQPRPRGYSTSTLVSPMSPITPITTTPIHHPSVLSLKAADSGDTPAAKPLVSPFLLRTLPKAPANPRDHSLLEGIYNEMNATRFINLSPLSLLANLMGLHFKDVRTHPPLQLTFPPPAPKLPEPEEVTTDDDSDSDDARNALIPSPKRRLSIKSSMRASTLLNSNPGSPRSATFTDALSMADEPRWVNTKDLLKRESRYIVLDETRRSAYSPAARSSFPAMSPVRPLSGLPDVDAPTESKEHPHPPPKMLPIYRTPEGQNRLPNNTFNIDVRTLNMHLALRVAEIVACTESMWEWVASYQANSRVAGRPRAGSLATEVPPRASRIFVKSDPATDAFKSAVLDLTREDFDDLLVRFELDMRDHMAIGSTLRDQFSWPSMPIAASQDRKAFNAACERWEQWQDHQRRKTLSPYGRHQARNSVDSAYVHIHEGNGTIDRPAGPKLEVARGRTPAVESVPPRRKPSRSKAPPDRRLINSRALLSPSGMPSTQVPPAFGECLFRRDRRSSVIARQKRRRRLIALCPFGRNRLIQHTQLLARRKG